MAGAGLIGDRYSTGEGSYNKDKIGKRQVTLMNARFFVGSGFEFPESRRNILIENIDLMRLIGEEFRIGGVLMKGVRYCTPCAKPGRLSGNSLIFRDVFLDAGGLLADVLEGGIIKVGDPISSPKKPWE